MVGDFPPGLRAARCNWYQDTKKGRDPKASPGSYSRVSPRCRGIAASRFAIMAYSLCVFMAARRHRRARLRARAKFRSHLDGLSANPLMISITPVPAIIPARKTTVANKMIDMVYSPCEGETRRPRPVGLLGLNRLDCGFERLCNLNGVERRILALLHTLDADRKSFN